MYSFKNDYSEGAHPRILQALAETNLKQTEGYGKDCFSEQAIKLLKELIGCNDVDIHFFSGGTQTNLTALSAFLKPYEAAIAVDTGHILVHETGAIEATGHKIIAAAGIDGKIEPLQLQEILDWHIDEHMVKPKLVFISNATEIGTVYTRQELEELSSFCKQNGLILYMDGARLGPALCCLESNLNISELAELVDAFYIGGTKNGALLGEALVICNNTLKENFRFHMKQKGALLAKGRLIGLQFLELFRDNLYFELAQHANDMAAILRAEISQAGFSFLTKSPTNQLFPILPLEVVNELQKNYEFMVWSKSCNDHLVIRLVTSWATTEQAVHGFGEGLKKLTVR
jgi:threonine aldolase